MNSPSRTRWAALGLVAASVVGLGLAGCGLVDPDSVDDPADSQSQDIRSGSDDSAASAHPGDAELGQPAPSQVDPHRPTLLQLPSGTGVAIDASATAADGELAIPADVERAGWWDGSSRIGDPFGAIVVAAHIDSFDQGLGRFAELLTVRRGERVTVHAGDLAQRFRIVSAELVPKSAVRAGADIFSVKGAPRLVLITCGGAYDSARGGYQDNLVVIAEPDGSLVGTRR